MRFLLSGSNKENYDTSSFAGIITTPSDYGIRRAIQSGAPFAVDNNAFGKGFDPDRFFAWLEELRPYREQCLFVVPPDEVGNAARTIALFEKWAPRLSDWTLAFVAQDGQERLDLPSPSMWSTLFVGGSTDWKESPAAIEVIKRAQAWGKHIHIGRVNWWRRYSLFIQIKGSEEFTCDGTRQRFEGIERTKAAWAEYQRRLALPLW